MELPATQYIDAAADIWY